VSGRSLTLVAYQIHATGVSGRGSLQAPVALDYPRIKKVVMNRPHGRAVVRAGVVARDGAARVIRLACTCRAKFSSVVSARMCWLRSVLRCALAFLWW